MKTDSLFYELFKAHPASLFELAGLEADGEYVFESITVKTTEKRMDGFFRRTDGSGRNIFLEVQGYDDRKIYWRLFREISTRYEQTDDEREFIAVVLFVDKKYDPENCPVKKFTPPNRLIRLYLPKCLKAIRDKAGPLTVLKPLVLPDKERLPEAVPKWKAEIDSMKLPESTEKLLIELLENAILSRFPKLTIKEIQKMIQLTPLDKTVAGQELIQMGIEKGFIDGIEKGILKGIEKGRIEGLKKGMDKGELIGEIRILQRILKYPQISKTELTQKSSKELRKLLKKLESEL